MTPENTNLLSSLYAYVSSNQDQIITGLLASGTYDAIKTVLNLTTLKTRIRKFFKTESEAQNYVEELCNKAAINLKKPHRDVEDAFEAVSKHQYDQALFEETISWIKDNYEQLSKLSSMEFNNQSGFNIGTQTAGKNIYNIKGDFNK